MKTIQDVLWSERTRAEFPDLARQGAVIIVPIASTEQHGLHLPVDTDCRTAEHVAREAARRLNDTPVLVAPLIPYGISPHHMMHPGTISIRVATLVAFLRDICESIVAHGFERILILSGHGGNGDTIRAAARELKHQLSRQIEATSWFDLIPETFLAVNEGPGTTIGHSGEAETSCILAISPGVVRRDRLTFVPGITDDPAIATTAKGERILEAGIEAVMARVRRLAALPGREVVGVEPLAAR